MAVLRPSVTRSVVLWLTLVGGVANAQEAPDLTSLSVDDLMNVEVTSVSRKGQTLSDTAAAVFVITQDDIRRSGATSIAEILRIVPGLDVARVNGNVWAISARGFNSQFANKLLVMIDGRSVYTPLFSGVYWNVQDTLLEDVDRIEVIRGPGGTLWGANAVNGIINIITKHSIETQGTLLSVGGGAAEGAFVAGRFGRSIGHRGHYRVYAKSFDRPDSLGDANPTHDAWNVGRAGFRADWDSRRGDNFTAQGELYRGSAATPGILVDPASPFADRASLERLEGGNLQFRWSATQSGRSDTTLQAYVDSTAKSQATLVNKGRTADLDFQHHLKLGHHDAVWGAQYRFIGIRADGPGFKLARDSNVTYLTSAFVQDEIQVARRFRVTVGTKLQYDPVSRLQLQPTLRFLFRAGERQTIWAAATSAVRTPSEIDLYGGTIVGSFPVGGGKAGLVLLRGTPDVKPERVASYEIGYRWQATPDIALDATAFHNEMRQLLGSVPTSPFVDASGQFFVPYAIANNGKGHADGAEFLLTDSITTNWNVALGYTFFRQATVNDNGLGSSSEVGQVAAPRHQAQLRSFIQLPQGLALSSAAYYVDRTGSDVPAYVRLDAQISWHATRQWELSLSGQNLLQARHAEFDSPLGTPSQRTVNGKVTWRY